MLRVDALIDRLQRSGDVEIKGCVLGILLCMQNVLEMLDDLVWDSTLCADELKKRVYRVLSQKVCFTLNWFLSLNKVKQWARENEDVFKDKCTRVSRIIRLNNYNHSDVNERILQHYARIEQNYGVIRFAASALLS